MPTHMIPGGGGLKLAVHEYGRANGPAIVLLHGFNQCQFAWIAQMHGALAKEFRLILPDNRGHGMSEKPLEPEHYTDSQRWADDLHAIISELKLHKPVLVGWSYGGLIINDYLAHYGQEALGGINYVCAAVLMGGQKAEGMFGEVLERFVPGMCSENPVENMQATRGFISAAFAQPPSDDQLNMMLAFNMLVPPAVRRTLVTRTIDRDDVMRRLTLPVLVTEGAKDFIILAAQTRHLLECVPHAEHSLYENIGHCPPLEAAERFNRELAEFAREHAG